ncbi:MAG: M20/M25/M40 family metallo-hydrolase [Opitutaceae bacterium]
MNSLKISRRQFRPLFLIGLFTLSLFPLVARAGDGSQTASSEPALARNLLRELVSINTTPSVGSTKAAEAMAARLRAAGFADADVLVMGPRHDRMNLVARLRGKGQAKPILLIAHLDTVDAPRDGWNSDPFQLTERDGFFYGRGVNDIKDADAILVANLIRLRAEGFVPDRDIIVALTADEETGTANGIDWLLKEHRDLMDIAYCLNLDAGGGLLEHGKHVSLSVQTGEKAHSSFQLEITNRGGHSSLPSKDNAIYRLAEGLVRLSHYESRSASTRRRAPISTACPRLKRARSPTT